MAHIDGPQPCWEWHQNTTRALIERKLIRWVERATSRPQHTIATNAGRHMMATILARTAERLIQAGCLEPMLADRLSEAVIFQKLAQTANSAKI